MACFVDSKWHSPWPDCARPQPAKEHVAHSHKVEGGQAQPRASQHAAGCEVIRVEETGAEGWRTCGQGFGI